LFVPGDRPERFEKARAAGADVVIVDLEDAVGIEAKDAARGSIAEFLHIDRPIAVRVNAVDTMWFNEDIAAIAGHPGVTAIVLPKAESAAQVNDVMRRGHDKLQVLPIIESARGFANMSEICSAKGVARVIFGTLDFQVDLGMDADDAELAPFRSGIVLASRLAGIAAPVDGVSTAIHDAALIEADARRGRRLGFGAKLCIHPAQIAAVHLAYAWTQAERTWAEQVLAAVERTNGGAAVVDGKMVDAPVIIKARRIAQSPR
jgi:citrate lyase subunit beta/citryl-CoA lyase